MLIQLIDHNPDLKRLNDEGFKIQIINGHLVIGGIPYVTSESKIEFGTIYCQLNLSGNHLYPPTDHTALFVGKHPCNQYGVPDESFVNSPRNHSLSETIHGNYFFSSKPEGGNYPDYYSKMKRYIELLSNPAKSIDPSVMANHFDYEFYDDASVFEFQDSHSARSDISEISNKLKEQTIAIVGLGGTGAYLLDHISKTHVKQISLFDGDELLNHNVFRMPGVILPNELDFKKSKVEFLKDKYSKFRKGIIANDVYLDASNVELLKDHDFVFISIDNTEAKKPIIEWLMTSKIPFIDLGMGLSKYNSSLRGQIRKTLVTPDNNDYLKRINMNPVNDDEVYRQNIQISELNALNAILGIISWKKTLGFYSSDSDNLLMNSVFILDEGELINEA